MTEQFIKILTGLQKEVAIEVEKFFGLKIKKTKGSFEKKILNWLKEYSLRKAKRIRAILVIYGYLLAKGKDRKAILKASIFIELIHNYLLIHDDMLDKAEERRGKKALHRLYGKDMAICAGDMINALGYEVLRSSCFPVNNKLKAIEKLNQTLYSTCYGQMLELQLRDKKTFTDKDILEIYTRKTAFYTLVTPLQIGALLAGANETFLKRIERFALPLGIAFQIRDDLQDGEIEGIFRSSRTKYEKLLEKFVTKAQKQLMAEKSFPKKEKEFLLNVADYTKKI